MTLGRRASWPLVLVVCLGVSGHLGTVDAKPPASSRPGTAVFGCGAVACRVIGDGSSYDGVGSATTGEGAHLTSANEMWLGVRGTPYTVTLDFAEPAPNTQAPCSSAGTCRLASILGSGSTVTIGPEDGDFKTLVLGSSGGGLLDVPVDGTRRSKLRISFNDPLGRGILWGVNFDAADFAGATELSVHRVDECTWRYSAGVDDLAGVVSFGSAAKGKRVRVDEGLFVMPFELTFHVPSLCGP